MFISGKKIIAKKYKLFFAQKKLQLSPGRNTSSGQLFDNFIEEPLITKKQLADKLNCSVSWINKLIAKKMISPIKVGKFVRFKFSDVVAALKKWSSS